MYLESSDVDSIQEKEDDSKKIKKMVTIQVYGFYVSVNMTYSSHFLLLTCVFQPLTEKAFTFILDTV